MSARKALSVKPGTVSWKKSGSNPTPRSRMLALLLLVPLAACPPDCDGPTDPGPIPGPTTTTTTAPIPPPRVDAPFTFDGFGGYTAFALGHPDQSERDVRAFAQAHMALGWNTARVCSETEFWDGSLYWLIRKPRDIQRVKWLLDIFATIPGAQVLLIGDCTLKRQVPLSETYAWAAQVADMLESNEYRNVAVETHNEFDNCRFRDDWGGRPSYCPGKPDVARHIALYRSRGIQWVTADDSLCKEDFPDKIGFRLANVGGAPADFHPCRNVNRVPWDPSADQMRQLVRVNGMTLLSETVAWGDDGQCSGLRTCDQNRIQSYVDRCASVDGCKFVFHSVNGLAGMIPGFIPVNR